MEDAAAKTSDSLIRADGLTRSFAHRPVVSELSLTVEREEAIAVFGPNGAGKTTLLRLFAGLLRPEKGALRVAGGDPRADARARGRIGLIGHQTMLYDALTAAENVELAARLYGVRDGRAASARALAAVGATPVSRIRVRALSRGMQQRVSIARAFVHEPSVILADEPFTALDEEAAQLVRELLRGVLARGGATVVVTHALDDGLALATRAVVMHRGRFIREDDCASLDRAAYRSAYRELVARAA